jgi:hypothetical protein
MAYSTLHGPFPISNADTLLGYNTSSPLPLVAMAGFPSMGFQSLKTTPRDLCPQERVRIFRVHSSIIVDLSAVAEKHVLGLLIEFSGIWMTNNKLGYARVDDLGFD